LDERVLGFNGTSKGGSFRLTKGGNYGVQREDIREKSLLWGKFGTKKRAAAGKDAREDSSPEKLDRRKRGRDAPV